MGWEWGDQPFQLSPNLSKLFFDNQNDTVKSRIAWLRGFPLLFLGISDRSGPEEVDSHGLKGCTVPHGREASDPDSFDPRGPIILGHGRLYTRPPPVLVFKLRPLLFGPACSNTHRLILIAKIVVLLAWLDRAGFSKRTMHAMRRVKGHSVPMLLVFDLDRGMSLRASHDLALFRKAEF